MKKIKFSWFLIRVFLRITASCANSDRGEGGSGLPGGESEPAHDPIATDPENRRGELLDSFGNVELDNPGTFEETITQSGLVN